jgi:hypothetical protein
LDSGFGWGNFRWARVFVIEFYVLHKPEAEKDPLEMVIFVLLITLKSYLAKETDIAPVGDGFGALFAILIQLCYSVFGVSERYLKFSLILTVDFYYVINKLIILIPDLH